MHIDTHIQKDRVSLRLHGRFDFSANSEFRSRAETALQVVQVHELEIDLAGVHYMDSSALGMLLMLRERAEAVGKRIVLSNCHGEVQQVLDIANFAKLFRIL